MHAKWNSVFQDEQNQGTITLPQLPHLILTSWRESKIELNTVQSKNLELSHGCFQENNSVFTQNNRGFNTN